MAVGRPDDRPAFAKWANKSSRSYFVFAGPLKIKVASSLISAD